MQVIFKANHIHEIHFENNNDNEDTFNGYVVCDVYDEENNKYVEARFAMPRVNIDKCLSNINMLTDVKDNNTYTTITINE